MSFMYYFQTPRTKSFKVTRTYNQNVLEDGKVELESTLSVTVHHKSIVHNNAIASESLASTPILSSGFVTPRANSSTRFRSEIDPSEKEDNESSRESSHFPPPPPHIEVCSNKYT